MKELQTEPFTNRILAVRNQLDSQSNIFLTLNLFIFLLGFDGQIIALIVLFILQNLKSPNCDQYEVKTERIFLVVVTFVIITQCFEHIQLLHNGL